MHELSVASDLLGFLLRIAEENGAATVLSARLRVGAGSCLNPDSLVFGFDALASGTAAAGCRLEIERTPAPVSCPACGWTGELLDLDAMSCPACETPALRIVGGRELTVDTVTVE